MRLGSNGSLTKISVGQLSAVYSTRPCRVAEIAANSPDRVRIPSCYVGKVSARDESGVGRICAIAVASRWFTRLRPEKR